MLSGIRGCHQRFSGYQKYKPMLALEPPSMKISMQAEYSKQNTKKKSSQFLLFYIFPRLPFFGKLPPFLMWRHPLLYTSLIVKARTGREKRSCLSTYWWWSFLSCYW